MDNRPTPRDIILYDKIKKEISEKYKHSAYRSGLIVKKYKSRNNIKNTFIHNIF